MRSRHPSRAVAGALLALLVGGAAAASDKPPHHRDGGFQNNYTEFRPRGLDQLIDWKLQAARADLPPPPQAPTPRVEPDLAFLHANARAGMAMRPTATWIGHATVLMQMGGLNLLTDPHFTERASPLSFAGPKRALPPGLALEQLPRIDLVLISHNHYDHLDLGSVQALNRQPGGPPLFVVPLGVAAWMRDAGIEHVVELDWWQAHRIGAVEVVLTPVQHWSGRSLTDRMRTLWGGYAVFAPDLHLYFTGDAGWSKDFADTRERFAPLQAAGRGGGFDLALIAIGAYEPRWFMKEQHLNPAEAVQVHRELGAKRSLGVHWGTFELTDEALDEPPRALAAARRAQGVADDAFIVLPVGGTWKLPARDGAGDGQGLPRPALAAQGRPAP
ncbi:MAG: MBL fold metallo-hydrolase, partial [Burkholderiales bacterium]|nr:MBL fold metallo-hydrolase [Burkholderiales bacterium]